MSAIQESVPSAARGKLIVVEGIDGTGKSTLVQFMKEKYAERDVPLQSVSILRDAPASAEIRAIVTGTQHPLHPTSEALLYMAAVLNTYHQKIVPLLEQGISVICDRSHISTLAYQVNDQAMTGNLAPRALANIAYQDIKVDALILLFGQTEESMKRVVQRDGKLDRIESRNRIYFKGVQEFYHRYRRSVQDQIPVYCYENIGDLKELQVFAHETAALLA